MLLRGGAFLLGCCTCLLLPHYTSVFWLAPLSLFIFYILIFVSVRLKLLKIFIAGVGWICLNVLIWGYYTSSTITVPQVTELQGYVCSIPHRQDQRQSFDFCASHLGGEQIAALRYSKFRMSWGNYTKAPSQELKAGQYWRLQVKVRPPHGRYNDSGFDYQKWMLSNSYAGSGYVRKELRFIGSKKSIASSYHASRQAIYQRLTDLIEATPERGMLLALAMGERSEISSEQWDNLKKSGTSHLMAISGLHIGVAALWSYWLVFFLWRQNSRLCQLISAQKVGQLAALLGGFCLLLMSGAALPAQRAFIMVTIVIISKWSGRHYQLGSLLGLALLVILIWHPFALLSASFWLSFLAVFVICLVIGRRAVNLNKLSGWFQVNWFLYLAMIPVSLAFFDMSSGVALLANLILIPLTSFVLIPCLYLGILLVPLSSTIAGFLFMLATEIIHFEYGLQALLASFNYPILQDSSGFFVILLLTLIFLCAILPFRLVSRAVYLPLVMMLVLTVTNPRQIMPLEMTVFDIGQGLAVYVETPQGNLLYDTGWGNKDYALASSTLLPYFKSRGVRSIDKLILSHGEADHAGGRDVIRQAVEVDQILSGEAIEDTPASSCHQYADWQWGKIKFSFIAYLPKDNNIHLMPGGNNASCVLSIRLPKSSILLTGDIEAPAELALIKQGLASHDILIAPHHGSLTSSSEAFVERLDARAVIFSAGYDNQWKHPRNEVVERYASHGSDLWITHRDGAIRVAFSEKSGTPQITSSRKNNPHFWLK